MPELPSKVREPCGARQARDCMPAMQICGTMPARVQLDWNDLQFFLALSREGSVAGAARAMKVDQSTASRRLAALEKSVGKKLFTRSAQGVLLTPEGKTAAAAAEQIGGALKSLERQLTTHAETPSGNVRISTSSGMSSWLAQILAGLRDSYPDLAVQVLTSPLPLDLMRGETDLAVRMFRPTAPDLVIRKLCDVGWSLYASASYLARRGPVADLETLEGHDVVGYDEALARSPGGQWLAKHVRGVRIAFVGDCPRVVTGAVEQGLGIGVLPCFLTASLTELRRLTPAVVASSEACLVVHPDLKDALRIRVVMDRLISLYTENAKLLSGLA
jgi:DNA-binding transcriptional LysR family regulator